MPREVAYQCHRGHGAYTSARCPKCYPARGRRRGQGGGSFRGGRSSARARVASVLASDQLVGHSIFDANSEQVMPLTDTARSDSSIERSETPAEK